MKQIITGEQAISWGVRLARAEVIAAYPMTSRSRAVPELSGWCARGELKARFLQVESERSAVAACIGASSAGARTFAAASAQDLAGMHEGLHRAAGARLPIVMALAPDGTVSTNRDDSLSQRDTGWIQIHCEGNQELLDSTIQAFKLAEVVDLPVMVVLDAFQLANTGEPVDIPEAAGVDAFLPARADRQGLDANELRAHGAPAPPALHMEMRLRQHLRRRSQRPFRTPEGVRDGAHLQRLGWVPLRRSAAQPAKA